MTVWYKVDSNRFTYRELWRLSGRGLAPFAQAALRKWFDVPRPLVYGYAFPETLDLVEFSAIPDRPRQVLGDMISQAERHGFRLALCHKSTTLGDLVGYAAALWNADGTPIGSAIWIRAGRREEATFSLGSRCDGRFILTDNQIRRIDPPPEFDCRHLPGKSIDELVAIHADRLDRLGRERVLRATAAEVAARVLEGRRRIHEYQRARGIHVLMTQDEIDRLSGVVIASLVAESGNPYQAPQEGEAGGIAALSAKKSNWQTSMAGGFGGGVISAEIVALISLRDALRQGLTTGELLFAYFLFFPILLGVLGAGLGLAIWLVGRIIRRFVS